MQKENSACPEEERKGGSAMLGEILNIEKILNACDRILYFLKINFFFLISNLPVLLFFLFVGISQVRTYLPLFLVCAVFAGPALCGVFFSMNRVLHHTDTAAWKDYRTGYTDCWGRKMIVAAVQAAAILVFWTNVEFFAVQMPVLPLMIVFLVLFVGTILMTPNLYLLASRYEMGVRDIVKGAVVLTITRPVNTLGNTAMLAVILMLLEIKAGTFILFIASIYGFVVVFMHQKIQRAMEESRS